ncbi:MAG: alanine--tRNA ligase [Planctomycetota bacterium]|nr:alanine--tRNA ligase [Planctomycetota bacterium]
MKTDEIREKYLEFFEQKGCVRRPSDVLVPRWDPSVLFTPAGMNQFKDHFLGKCKLEFTKATTSQKCLRTGDIDNVGRTAYHHTFFEMLGNFSFGDYFKREAIHWAWEFLTSKKWMNLPADRLTVSVYLDDDEAYNIWHDEVKLPADRIVRMGEDDNFWPAGAPSQGPDGVCGPCSEIFFHPPTGGEVEIWNLVFTQFNRVGEPPNNLRPLPSKNIDTGMGLERIASVMQGVETNYHIDTLRPLVEAAGEVCGVKYDPKSDTGRRLRRIADHVRACAFAVHENVYPDSKKQGYVIKRLLRRAVLDGHQMNRREPFLYQLVPTVAQMVKVPYPELGETIERVQQVIRGEEANFLRTIDGGLERLERMFETMKREKRSLIAGEEAQSLYTTYGFPPELQETLAAEHNLQFDWPGFRKSMDEHGIKSGGGVVADVFTHSPIDSIAKTNEPTKFLGYDTLTASGKIIGIIAQGQLCETMDEIGHEQPVTVVLDQTPFYGESGGQTGDVGTLSGNGFEFEVIDTLKEKGFILHQGHLRNGTLKVNVNVNAVVDETRRGGIRRAHSATHILHHALQKYLGTHAQQQGSKVDNDWLRFDFANPASIDHDTLVSIENEVNDRITNAEPVGWNYMPLAEARKTGAMMLFGEKYPDTVRLVQMGEFSKELCGGTHVGNTGQIGLFRVIGEESVSAGTRRITAVTGRAALDRIRQGEAALSEIATALRVPVSEAATRVTALAKEVRELKKQLSAGKATGISAEKLLEESSKVGGVKVIVAEAPGVAAQGMRELIDQLRKTAAPIAVLLANRDDDKVTIVAGITRDLEERGLNAGEWIKAAAEVVGGRGGGRADMAQAGGKNPAKLPEALKAASARINELLPK